MFSYTHSGMLTSAMEFVQHCEILQQKRRLDCEFYPARGDLSTTGEILVL